MKLSTIRKAKLYWGRAANLREKIAIAKAAGHETAELASLAAKYQALSRRLFDSLPSSKAKALNLAKLKEAKAAQKPIRRSRALGPPPTEGWVIVKKKQ